MASVLVVGGTGTLGRSVVIELARRGHQVRVLSRRADAKVPVGVSVAQGDARRGGGVAATLEGTDAVVLSIASCRRPRTTELGAMSTMLGSVGERHLIDVSIVGVDQNRYSYFKAKLEAEHMLESSAARWTIQRATQFHDLIDRFLGLPVFFRTPDLRFQPIDTRDVAIRLAELVEAGPSGRVPDLGGPEVLGIEQLARVRRELTGKRARLVRLPRVGMVGEFDRGGHLVPAGAVEGTTWAEWLRSKPAGRGG